MSSERVASNRLHARAQSRALHDLRRAHPNEYLTLYDRHKTDLQCRYCGGAHPVEACTERPLAPS